MFSETSIRCSQNRSGPEHRHCLVEDLLDGRSAVEGLMRLIVVVVVSEPLKPAASALGTVLPECMKAVDPQQEGLKPPFDGVSLAILELTAQPPTKQGSQVASASNQKFSV